MKLLTEADIAPLFDASMPKDGERPLGGYLWKHQHPEIQRRLVSLLNEILAEFGGGISEADVREAQRRAWDSAIALYGEEYVHGRMAEIAAQVRDRRFPSLTNPAPRTVTLSNGMVWERVMTRTARAWKCVSHPDCIDKTAGAYCVTDEDFEKCVALLKAEAKS